ncbi:c-type cytochrome [Aeromonas sp. EERV15]|uniref:c-type cytochrome n=1 Tax=Aeromonas sp. EERV15 TaxID=1833892 RepID=UPI0034CE0F59
MGTGLLDLLHRACSAELPVVATRRCAVTSLSADQCAGCHCSRPLGIQPLPPTLATKQYRAGRARHNQYPRPLHRRARTGVRESTAHLVTTD